MSNQSPPILHNLIAPLSNRLGRIFDSLGKNRALSDPRKTVSPRIQQAIHPRTTKNIADHLNIPSPIDTPEQIERMAYQTRGQFLSRQEDWSTLADLIFKADQSREKTGGDMPVADLLAYGARADVVLAGEHALFDGALTKDAPLMAGIEALEAVLARHPDNYPVALVVAHAHMDIGWAWRGTGWESELKPQNREAFSAHFDRAAGILNKFCGVQNNSPALAAARCALLAGNRQARTRAADDYEYLIDLDRHNPRHMRAMGNHLLPRWFGSHAQLELEARRTASRTQDIWGAGAYTWVYFDAIVIDDDACAQLDVPFFVEGLKDILARSPDQHTANLLASYCSVAIRAGCGTGDEADHVRHQIISCTDWIIRDHLTEIHPMLWAHATQGFDNSARISSVRRFADRGRADALEIIGSLFRDDIAQGHQITFTPDGPLITQG